MILDFDKLRIEHAKTYQVDEGSARREGVNSESIVVDSSLNLQFTDLYFTWIWAMCL
jgi:hypothetical protein